MIGRGIIHRKQNLQTETLPENSPTECKNERQNWISTNLKFWEKNRLWPSISAQHYPLIDPGSLIRLRSLVPVQQYKNLKIVSKAKKKRGQWRGTTLSLRDTPLLHWLVYKVITEWWMCATTPFSLLSCLFLKQQCGGGMGRGELVLPCPSYQQCSRWSWLSSAVTHGSSSALGWHQFLFIFRMLLNPTKLRSFQQSHPLRNDQWNQSPSFRASLPLGFPKVCSRPVHIIDSAF